MGGVKAARPTFGVLRRRRLARAALGAGALARAPVLRRAALSRRARAGCGVLHNPIPQKLRRGKGVPTRWSRSPTEIPFDALMQISPSTETDSGL